METRVEVEVVKTEKLVLELSKVEARELTKAAREARSLLLEQDTYRYWIKTGWNKAAALLDQLADAIDEDLI